jgi:hypothetical protein
MPMFVKLSRPQEAVQWHKPGDHPAVVHISAEHSSEDGSVIGPVYGIQTLEGPMRVTPGDWIMTGPRGEHWAIKPAIFAETYREVTPKELETYAEIEQMRNAPGIPGSFYRLMARISVHHVRQWCEGEKLRGVPPETMFDALGEFVGIAVAYGSGMVGRVKMHKAAGEIYKYSHQRTQSELRDLEEKKRSKSVITLVKG